jgi:hypothetical protein
MIFIYCFFPEVFPERTARTFLMNEIVKDTNTFNIIDSYTQHLYKDVRSLQQNIVNYLGQQKL